jgi:hypothetical protein
MCIHLYMTAFLQQASCQREISVQDNTERQGASQMDSRDISRSWLLAKYKVLLTI